VLVLLPPGCYGLLRSMTGLPEAAFPAFTVKVARSAVV